MSATVIEAVCIDLLIILKCIICIVQCYTLSSERFIDTFCFCLNKASVDYKATRTLLCEEAMLWDKSHARVRFLLSDVNDGFETQRSYT